MKTKKGAVCLPNILRLLLHRQLCHCKNINTLLQYGNFQDWLLSLSITICWFVQVIDCISPFFLLLSSGPAYGCTSIF